MADPFLPPSFSPPPSAPLAPGPPFRHNGPRRTEEKPSATDRRKSFGRDPAPLRPA